MQKIHCLFILSMLCISYKTFAQVNGQDNIPREIQESDYAQALEKYIHYQAVANQHIDVGNWDEATKYADSMHFATKNMTQYVHRYDKIFATAQSFIQQAKIADYKCTADVCLSKYNKAKNMLLKYRNNTASFAQCDSLLTYTYSNMIDYIVNNKDKIKELDSKDAVADTKQLLNEMNKYTKKTPLQQAAYYKTRGDVYLYNEERNVYLAKKSYNKSLEFLYKAYQKNTDHQHYLHQRALLRAKIGFAETDRDSVQICFEKAIDTLTMLCAKYPTNNDFQQDLTFIYQRKIEKYLQQGYYGAYNQTDLAADVLHVDGFLQYSYKERRRKGAFDYQKWSKITFDTLIKALDTHSIAIKILRHTNFDNKNEIQYHALIFSKDIGYPVRLVKVWRGNESEENELNNYSKLDTNLLVLNIKQSKSNTILWQPIQAAIKDIHFTTIYFNSAGVYDNINIEAFKNGDKYWIETHEIHYISALQNILTRQDYTLQNNTSIMILGKPKYICPPPDKKKMIDEAKNRDDAFRSSTAELEHAKKEEEKLLIKFAANTPFLLNDTTITKNNIQKNALNYNILWFIGHGGGSEVAQKNILDAYCFYTYCRNSTDDKEKRYTSFTGNDASNLVLNHTELVVLSICRGREGQIVPYEGRYSLAHGFKMAGAKAIIASIFEVGDKKTATFMDIFAKHVINKMSYFDALRQTKLDMIKKDSTNINWRHFIMIE